MFESTQEMFNKAIDEKTDSSDSDLIQSINKIIKSEGYITYSINVKNISTEGGNYMSSLKEADITGETINNEKKTNLFIKLRLPSNDKEILSPEELFMKEWFVYTELKEVFDELQNKFNVPDDEKYKFVKCYNTDNASSLIFDNMVRKGFKIYNRFDEISLKALELSIEQLAKFHAISMVMEQYKPDFYKDNIQTLKHALKFNEKGKTIVTSLCNIALKYLDDDKKIKLDKYLLGLFDKYNRYLHGNEGKVKCLCHGDYRMNNILVKEKNGEAVEVIPIDYQLINYGSPVIDLIFIIFLTSNQQFRRDNMEHLKKIYYESFTKFLRYFEIDAESVYAKKDYEEDFKNQLDYGLIIAMVFMPFIFVSEDDVPEVNEELKTMTLHDNFKPRFEEIVDDFIEWGYL